VHKTFRIDWASNDWTANTEFRRSKTVVRDENASQINDHPSFLGGAIVTQEASMPDNNMQELLKRLVSTMKAALSESPEVLHVVEDIEACGFKVMLVVDAALQPVDQALWTAPSSRPVSAPQLQLSANDLTWLKSLRITSNPEHPNLP
jgi:hypothetical protein